MPAPRALPAATGVAEFVAEVLGLYHKNFWLFFWIVAPAVALGWWAIASGSDEAREIALRLLRKGDFSGHLLEYIEMGLVNMAGLFGSWTVFALAFAGICVAVQNWQLESHRLSASASFLCASGSAHSCAYRVCYLSS